MFLLHCRIGYLTTELVFGREQRSEELKSEKEVGKVLKKEMGESWGAAIGDFPWEVVVDSAALGFVLAIVWAVVVGYLEVVEERGEPKMAGV